MKKFFVITYLEFFLKTESKKSMAFQNKALKKDYCKLALKRIF